MWPYFQPSCQFWWQLNCLFFVEKRSNSSGVKNQNHKLWETKEHGFWPQFPVHSLHKFLMKPISLVKKGSRMVCHLTCTSWWRCWGTLEPIGWGSLLHVSCKLPAWQMGLKCGMQASQAILMSVSTQQCSEWHCCAGISAGRHPDGKWAGREQWWFHLWLPFMQKEVVGSVGVRKSGGSFRCC